MIPALKDETAEHPIPTAWRETLKAMVAAIARGDCRKAGELPGVLPVPPETAVYVHNSIKSYGTVVGDLPEEGWQSSVCMWYRLHWDALIDLWSEGKEPTDLVMSVRIRELEVGFSYELQGVYVP